MYKQCLSFHASFILQLFHKITLIAFPINFRCTRYNHKGILILHADDVFHFLHILFPDDTQNHLLVGILVSPLSFQIGNAGINLYENPLCDPF